MTDLLPAGAKRLVHHPVDPLFPNRWSPRAMSGAHIAPETLRSLFEAARWAPSCNNSQPWRFIYALRATDAWPRFFNLLVPSNQVWCKEAGALVVMVSRNAFEYNGKPSPTHSFDTGAAWMSLALQASMLGLVSHGLAGFDYGAAAGAVGLPEGYTVEAMCALGYPGALESLPETLRSRETPNDRKRVEEFAFEAKMTVPEK